MNSVIQWLKIGIYHWYRSQGGNIGPSASGLVDFSEPCKVNLGLYKATSVASLSEGVSTSWWVQGWQAYALHGVCISCSHAYPGKWSKFGNCWQYAFISAKARRITLLRRAKIWWHSETPTFQTQHCMPSSIKHSARHDRSLSHLKTQYFRAPVQINRLWMALLLKQGA